MDCHTLGTTYVPGASQMSSAIQGRVAYSCEAAKPLGAASRSRCASISVTNCRRAPRGGPIAHPSTTFCCPPVPPAHLCLITRCCATVFSQLISLHTYLHHQTSSTNSASPSHHFPPVPIPRSLSLSLSLSLSFPTPPSLL